MKTIPFLFFLFIFSAFSQNSISCKLIDLIKLEADYVIGIDNFNNSVYTKNNTIYKQREDGLINYSNVQLGEITSVNNFNPLKINVFYKAFNTVIVLDNRLAEIYKIDFNNTNPYKNVALVSTGNDNTIWFFNQDAMHLELYDYKTNTTRAKTLPVANNITAITSNYNYCWALTKNYIYKYNYFGSLVSKIDNKGYTAIYETNENLILKKGNMLFYNPKNSTNILPIEITNLLINRFFVTNQNLYIYSGKTLHKYQLKLL